LTILTCYATSIVVIYLNLSASMRLFTFDTNGGYLLSMTVKGQQIKNYTA